MDETNYDFLGLEVVVQARVIEDLHNECDDLSKEVSYWRDKYWESDSQYWIVKDQYDGLVDRIETLHNGVKQ